MKVTVKLFAFLGERLGPAVKIDVPKSVTQAALKDAVLELDPALEATLANSRVAVDQEFINEDVLQLSEASEVALIPPVSGG
ncbi:MoaD/ThiS family protein [Limosilactobacillus fermentum]|uniref:MoaD/ThiS family protein n=1 Tax=Limosilactobacillus fermentum TaxID=1613 RepID=UPI003F6630B2